MGQWLTPDTLPAADLRRVLLVPDGPEWLAVLTGVLLDLADPANWQQFGTLTPQETADKWNEILEAWFAGEECP